MKQVLLFAVCLCTLVIIAGSCSQDAALRQGPIGMTAAELAEKFRSSLASLDDLEVRSEQRVSFLRREIDPERDDGGKRPQRSALAAIADYKDEVAAVDVRIWASMTRDSYRVKMWKGEMSQPVTEVSLTVDEGVPTIVERQWYPVLDDYRTAKYPSPHRCGYDDPTLPSSLFDGLTTNVCATAEFFQRWLGDDSNQADSFEWIVTRATAVPVQTETYRGKRTYRLKRQTYEDDEAELYRSGLQTFWIDAESYLLVGWRSENVSIHYGDRASYRVVDRHYDYPKLTAQRGER